MDLWQNIAWHDQNTVFTGHRQHHNLPHAPTAGHTHSVLQATRFGTQVGPDPGSNEAEAEAGALAGPQMQTSEDAAGVAQATPQGLPHPCV